MNIIFNGEDIPPFTREFFLEQIAKVHDGMEVIIAMYIGRKQLREIDANFNHVKVIPDPTKPPGEPLPLPRQITPVDLDNPPGLLQVAGAPCYVLDVESHFTLIGG